jgi:regulator of PEP synthase PpsR (kinase-PPPase family)
MSPRDGAADGSKELTIHILSDSLGETADTVARAAAVQFPKQVFKMERLPRVSSPVQLRELVEAHCGPDCIFFYTLAQEPMQAEMAVVCGELEVNAVDVLGPGVDALAAASGSPPSGEMGVMRRTDRSYFDRIEAMEFAVKHDDGRNPSGLKDAEIVLVGVSRTSKTPLSMYLAFKGYRTANVPLAPGSDPPRELYDIDPRRIFGVTSDADLLAQIRAARAVDLGGYARRYADPIAVDEELREARALMRRLGAHVIKTDNRAVEESSREILSRLEESELA